MPFKSPVHLYLPFVDLQLKVKYISRPCSLLSFFIKLIIGVFQIAYTCKKDAEDRGPFLPLSKYLARMKYEIRYPQSYFLQSYSLYYFILFHRVLILSYRAVILSGFIVQV